jgi:acetate kinase
MVDKRLLTINTGSSSLKAALYCLPPASGPLLTMRVERLGGAGGRLRALGADGATLFERDGTLPDHAAAIAAALGWLRDAGHDVGLAAIGHRIVHGGERYREPAPVDDAMVATLRALLPLDPEHLPQALAALATVGRIYPALPQVACFDTAFHRQMPAAARAYALPREYREAGVVRYGFHGLSYEYLLGALRDEDPAAAAGRVIIAHLGNGASMAAVRGGIGVDTTMGFTPTGGLVMGTRVGDLDPGVSIHLLRSHGLDAAGLGDLVNRRSGLLGVSETSGDMRDLLAREATDPRAAEAISLFCYAAKKALGGLAAALGGLDTLIFAGGIGEGAAPVRARICDGLGFLGIALDPGRNEAHAPVVSREGGPVVVRVMHTDEDLMIARHTARLLGQGGAPDVSV